MPLANPVIIQGIFSYITFIIVDLVALWEKAHFEYICPHSPRLFEVN